MPKPISALEYLAAPERHAPRPVCVVFGPEAFLRREAIDRIQKAVLPDEDAEFSLTRLPAETIEDPRLVFDELATSALFGGGRRVVLIYDADPFVSNHRAALERYVASPKPTGVLLLEVRTWPATTKLFKALAETGLQIACDSPKEAERSRWMRQRAEKHYGAALDANAAEAIGRIMGDDLGRIDQELNKLSAIAASAALGDGAAPTIVGDAIPPAPQTAVKRKAQPAPRITSQMVDDHVAGWQIKTAWSMIDAAADGDLKTALTELDRLIAGGENEIGLLAMTASKLRTLASAQRILSEAQAEGRRISVREALETTGAKVWPEFLRKAEQQLAQLSPLRAGKLYEWLLEADLALKGSRSSGERARRVLEELFARMARRTADKSGGVGSKTGPR